MTSAPNLDLAKQEVPAYDLVIIGYGMVGSIAALLATHYKLKVAVMEIRHANDLYIPKAGRIDAEVLRIFEHLGLRKEVEKLLHPLHKTAVVDKNNHLLFELKHQEIEGFAPMYGMYQPDVQALLHKKIKQQSRKYINVYEKHRAEAIEQAKDYVKIIAYNLENDQFFELKTRFLLACNGQESLVPAQCDLKYEYFSYSNFTLNVDTYCKDALTLPFCARTICDTKYPVTCITDSAHHQRWEFRLDPDTIALPDISEQVRKILEQLISGEFEIQNSFIHSYETRVLNKWQRKRIFITGDAAHVIPPYLGVGLSAGIKDVYNLIWKISLVSEHSLAGKILDYYQGEREGNVRYLLQLNLGVQKLFNSRWLSFARYLLPFIPKTFLEKNLNLGTLVKIGLVGAKHKLSGTCIPYFKVYGPSGKETSIDSLLGDGFVFIAFGKDPVDATTPKEIEYLAHAGVKFVKIISKNEQLTLDGRYSEHWQDRDGKMEQWFLKYRIKYLFLRPDRILFDAARNEKQLRKMLQVLKAKMPLRGELKIEN